MPPSPIDLETARKQVLDSVRPLDAEWRPLEDGLDLTAAEDITATVDAPSAASSLKDGYALRAADIAGASAENPVRLTLSGTAPAGAKDLTSVSSQSAVRILTGGRIPRGADAVLAEELTRQEGRRLLVRKPVGVGRDILPQGSDVAVGDTVVRAGERLTPGRLGLLAAAGHSRILVYRRPRVAIIATGDEIRLPGQSLEKGQVYASNAVTLEAWCRRQRCTTTVTVVADRLEAIEAALREAVTTCDLVLTSGGAWAGERDLVAPALEALDWQPLFRRVRMMPGKGTGMGLLGRCPVFALPGGPPGNLAAFLKLALPVLLKISGALNADLPRQGVHLKDAIHGRRHAARIVFGRLQDDKDGKVWFQISPQASRLKALAEAQALLTVPEGEAPLAAGTRVGVACLT